MLPARRGFRNQHDMIAATLDEYLIALKAEFLGQAYGLAIALLEYLG